MIVGYHARKEPAASDTVWSMARMSFSGARPSSVDGSERPAPGWTAHRHRSMSSSAQRESVPAGSLSLALLIGWPRVGVSAGATVGRDLL